MSCNRVDLSGKVVEISVLRHTPAGFPVLSFKVAHASEQIEAGAMRQVHCEVPVIAIGDAAKMAVGLKIGDFVSVEGFLARRSLKSTQLTLHVNQLKLIKEEG